MSYQNSVNVLTKRFAQANSAGYVTLYAAETIKNMFGVRCATQAMQVSIGPIAADATDAASVLVAADIAFEINVGLVGEVSIKVAVDATVDAYGA